jgi:aminoglycoside phosphotransferase
MLFFVFPFDRKIPGLRLLTDPGKLKRFVNDALANGPDRRVSAKRSRTELLRYKPERRAVMRADLGIVDGGGDVIERRQVHLKAYADGTGERTHRVMRFLEEHSARLGGLGLARSLGYAARERVVAQEALPGEQLVLKRDGRSCVRATGAALAGLHALETGSLPVNDNQTASGLLSEVRSGATYFESIAAEEPALRMASIAERLAVRLPEARTAVVHGDFYAHQVLVNGDAVAFVDFDEGGAGDPRVDIGNFIAHLRLQSMQEPGSVETGIETSFLEGYASGRGTSDEVDWFTTACLARLAVAPFRALRPDWNREAGAILDAALKAIGS